MLPTTAASANRAGVRNPSVLAMAMYLHVDVAAVASGDGADSGDAARRKRCPLHGVRA